MEPLRLIKSPLDGVVILGQQQYKGTAFATKLRITEAIKDFFDDCPVPYGRTVSYREFFEGGNTTWYWHNDGPNRFMITVCFTGPGTEFIAKPSFEIRNFCSSQAIVNAGGKVYPRYNFPNGTLLLVDNARILHRVPPWLRQTRYVYRWGDCDEKAILQRLDEAALLA